MWNRPKLYGNCAFPQNFHTRNLGKITGFTQCTFYVKSSLSNQFFSPPWIVIPSEHQHDVVDRSDRRKWTMKILVSMLKVFEVKNKLQLRKVAVTLNVLNIPQTYIQSLWKKHNISSKLIIKTPTQRQLTSF